MQLEMQQYLMHMSCVPCLWSRLYGIRGGPVLLVPEKCVKIRRTLTPEAQVQTLWQLTFGSLVAVDQTQAVQKWLH